MQGERLDQFSAIFRERDDLLPSSEISEKIIGCAFRVSNTLGCGFLEKVYENALVYELKKTGFSVEQQVAMEVFYDGQLVGIYYADIIVNSQIIVEVKALRAIDDSHKSQTLNYLKATGKRLGLLINFGASRVEVKRVAL